MISRKNIETAIPCGILNLLVNKYDNAWGALVFAMLMDLPEKFAAKSICLALLILGLLTYCRKFLIEYCKDFEEYFKGEPTCFFQ